MPYKVFATSNGHVILAVGNDRQFQDWCAAAEAHDLKNDPRYATNPLRIANRQTLYETMPDFMEKKTTEEWLIKLAELKVPCSPVNDIYKRIHGLLCYTASLCVYCDFFNASWIADLLYGRFSGTGPGRPGSFFRVSSMVILVSGSGIVYAVMGRRT